MKHFCVMHVNQGMHFYQCMESQCATCERYQRGEVAPRFAVPAIPIKVGYMPWSWKQDFPSAYWYIANRFLLWTCFKRWGFTQERI